MGPYFAAGLFSRGILGNHEKWTGAPCYVSLALRTLTSVYGRWRGSVKTGTHDTTRTCSLRTYGPFTHSLPPSLYFFLLGFMFA